MSISISGAGSFTGATSEYTFDQSVGVAGTLTYEDVTDVDAIGIITARSGVSYGAPGAATVIDGNATGIGIGTDNPNFSSFGSNTGGLEISDVNTNNALLVQSGTNEFYFANTSSANYIWGDDDAPLIIATNDTERLRITAAGAIKLNDNNIELTGAGGGVTTAYNNAGWEKIVFDASYNQNPIGPNKIILQNDSNGGGWYAGFGIATNELSIYSGGNTVFYRGFNNASAINESLRIDTIGRILIGSQRTFGNATYYDDITVNNSNNTSGAAGGTGLTLISGTSSWNAIIFGDTPSNVQNAGYIKYSHASDFMQFATGGFERLRITNDKVQFSVDAKVDSDNARDLGASGARWKDLYLSGGLYVGGTGSDNYLDDYEEGTWVPTISGSSSNPTINYVLRRGYYSKIGSQVTLWFDIGWNSKSGGSGNVQITGIPINTGSGYYHGFGVLSHGTGFTEAAGARGIYANASANFLYIIRTTSNATVVGTNNMANNGHIFGGITYRTGTI